MKRQWTHDELTEHWTLLPDELKLLAHKTGAKRLGYEWSGRTIKYHRVQIRGHSECRKSRSGQRISI